MQDTQVKTYKGKYGYYPCSKETYLKLKEMNKKLTKAKKMAAAWNRWHRKDPHNRKGPEPELMPFFCAKSVKDVWFQSERTHDSYWFIDGESYRSTPYKERHHLLPLGYKIHPTGITVMTHGIDFMYRMARFPMPSEDVVQPLPMSEKEIEEFYKKVMECTVSEVQ